MKKVNLTVTKREMLGKKIKKLRREGILPANIYGKGIPSQAVQVPLQDFNQVYDEVGETGLLYLDFEGKERPVLIHNVQLDYMDRKPLHADFFQVNLKEKVRTMVPIVIAGEAKAVADNLGQLLQTLNEVEVEALPTDLPESYEIDVTNLAAVNDQLTVADLKKIEGVEVLNDPAQTVVKIAELVEPEPEPVVEEAAPAEGEATEGEAGEATEGEATASDSTEEKKSEEEAK